MLTKTAQDIRYQLVTKTGSIQFPHDFIGRPLEIEIAKATESFVRSMELRGWTLFQGLPKNPTWLSGESGSLVPFTAIDWMGEFTSTKRARGAEKALTGGDRYQTRESHRGPLPTQRERSLEDSDGMVEYRCVGVFWAPEAVIEVLGDSYIRKQDERAARNPHIYGPSGTPLLKNA